MLSSLLLLYKSTFRLLSLRRKFQVFLLLLFNLLNGFAELVTLASIIPFLTFITSGLSFINSSDSPYMSFIVSKIPNAWSTDFLAILFTLLFALVIILASSIRLINYWLSHRLSSLIGTDLASILFENTICQPYIFHINTNSSTVIAATTSHITSLVALIDNSLLLVSSFTISFSIIIGILFLEFNLSLVLILIFCCSYYLIYSLIGNIVYNNGNVIASNKTFIIKFIQESLGSIKNIILSGNHFYYLNRFRTIDASIRTRIASNSFLGIFPRFLLETLGLILLASTGTFLFITNDSNSNIVLTIGTLAVAAQRLLPSFQQLYSQLTGIKGLISPSLLALDFLQLKPSNTINNSDLNRNNQVLKNTISFKDVSFSYDNNNLILDNLNFSIQRGQTIGIIGTTGSGKSTLIDLLMTLLQPTHGTITLDNEVLSQVSNPKLVSEWRASIALVPQHIYLTDSSLAQNIAFGIHPDDIDYQKVRTCADIANISSFIDSLPCGFNTNVGERGVKVSGGQLQRIGIARALYLSPSILILDEATSALDPHTEVSVMNSIKINSKSITVIMISHRLHSLTSCDFVFDLKCGKISSFYSRREFIQQFFA